MKIIKSDHPKKWTCLEASCGRILANKTSFDRHMIIHRGNKKFVCHFCGKSFILKPYLKNHLDVHTGRKGFECKHPGCNMKFRQAGKLSIHKRLHSDKKFYLIRPLKIRKGQEINSLLVGNIDYVVEKTQKNAQKGELSKGEITMDNKNQIFPEPLNSFKVFDYQDAKVVHIVKQPKQHPTM